MCIVIVQHCGPATIVVASALLCKPGYVIIINVIGLIIYRNPVVFVKNIRVIKSFVIRGCSLGNIITHKNQCSIS